MQITIPFSILLCEEWGIFLNQTDIDAIIFDIFDLYRKSNRQIFPGIFNEVNLLENWFIIAL
jgi:hypothetical protein